MEGERWGKRGRGEDVGPALFLLLAVVFHIARFVENLELDPARDTHVRDLAP